MRTEPLPVPKTADDLAKFRTKILSWVRNFNKVDLNLEEMYGEVMLKIFERPKNQPASGLPKVILRFKECCARKMFFGECVITAEEARKWVGVSEEVWEAFHNATPEQLRKHSPLTTFPKPVKANGDYYKRRAKYTAKLRYRVADVLDLTEKVVSTTEAGRAALQARVIPAIVAAVSPTPMFFENYLRRAVRRYAQNWLRSNGRHHQERPGSCFSSLADCKGNTDGWEERINLASNAHVYVGRMTPDSVACGGDPSEDIESHLDVDRKREITNRLFKSIPSVVRAHLIKMLQRRTNNLTLTEAIPELVRQGKITDAQADFIRVQVARHIR